MKNVPVSNSGQPTFFSPKKCMRPHDYSLLNSFCYLRFRINEDLHGHIKSFTVKLFYLKMTPPPLLTVFISARRQRWELEIQ